jgi:uncharacterized membrane protein
MIFSQDILFHLAVFILAIAGFFVAYHIRHHKVNNKVLVCPMNMDCHGVVHSDYATIWKLPVELLGMAYYAFTSIFSLISILVPHLLPQYFQNILSVTSIAAFIFSIYLISIQLFVLKKGCYWCFCSATFCILIFIFTLLASGI